jgi:hypothetical protein
MPTPQKSHDLNLPAWGPYSKRYAGIAHIPDVRRGLRFDLGVIPGHYRRQMLVPNEKWASGHHAWEAAPDLSYYAYRYEIEWKDQIYCDVSFSEISKHARLVRCAFINNTDLAQNLMLHLIAYMNFPPVRPYSDEPIRLALVSLPAGGIWIDALDYEDLQFAVGRPTDNLVPDGMLRAEIRDHDLVNGSGIGCGFGLDPGDRILFRFALDRPLHRTALTFRYRLDGPGPARFYLEGTLQTEMELTGENRDDSGFSHMALPAGAFEAGEQSLLLTSLGGASIELDGFAVTEAHQAGDVRFEIHAWTHTPEIISGPQPNSLILQYADTDVAYGLAWDHPDFWLRQLRHDELDSFLRLIVPDNTSTVQHGPGEGHFTDAFLRPIPLSPHSETTVYGLVCAGSRSQVEESLADFARQNSNTFEDLYASAQNKAVSMDCLPSGETYQFSQERMAATELLNVVYPI